MKTLRSEHGQQFILVALLLPFLIAFLGLVVDIGKVFVHQRRVQNAADAAAVAAGMVLYTQGRTVAVNTATYYATRNGYTDNGGTVRVWPTQPPASGAYAGNVKYIQVEVQEEVTPIFAAVVWNGKFTLHAKATAGYKNVAVGADLWALKDTPTCDGYISMTMNGNTGKIRAITGVVQVNSPCNNAVYAGNGDVSARVINISGPNYSRKPNSIFTPAATLNAPPIPDPFAELATPSTAGCLSRDSNPVNGKYLPGNYNLNTFTPASGIVFDGSGGECNGVFRFYNGTLNYTGSQPLTVTNGMFYFEDGGLILGGTSAMVGTAPTTGTYAGMLIFVARNNTSTVYLHGSPVANCSQAAANVRGIMYAPAGRLNVQGTSDQCYAGALLGWTIEQNGNATTTLVTYPGTIPPTTESNSQVE